MKNDTRLKNSLLLLIIPIAKCITTELPTESNFLRNFSVWMVLSGRKDFLPWVKGAAKARLQGAGWGNMYAEDLDQCTYWGPGKILK